MKNISTLKKALANSEQSAIEKANYLTNLINREKHFTKNYDSLTHQRSYAYGQRWTYRAIIELIEELENEE